jgi:hypothetical protein
VTAVGSDAALRDAAIALLRANDTGGFVKPARHQYPHLWNWDAAFIAIGLRHVDPAWARREIDALLAAQWRDGMIPHIVYPTGASDYFPTPDYWRTDALPHGGDVASSGLTQPPLLATAIRMLWEADPAPDTAAWVARIYPKLLASHRWWRDARDPDGSGLVAIVHPWESGTDNSARWDAALRAITDPTPPPYARGDRRHVHAEERPEAGDYDRYMHLIGVYRAWRWEPKRMHAEAPFLIADVLTNAILLRADDDLAAIGRRLGADVTELEGWRSRGLRALRGLWDDARGLYLDVDLRHGTRPDANTWVTFAPWFAGSSDAAIDARLVDGQLLRDGGFSGGRYRVPTVAFDDAAFEPRRYWRGPIWINANWLVAEGLRRIGRVDVAREIERDTLDLVRGAGFVEYFDPRDGSACGARDFSWSAALTLDLLAHAR